MAKQQFPPKEIDPLPTAEDLADSIQAIADSMKRLFSSRLTREAIVVLLAESSKLSPTTIRTVLSNLERFDQIWLNKKVR